MWIGEIVQLVKENSGDMLSGKSVSRIALFASLDLLLPHKSRLIMDSMSGIR
jgi:hypothetical protein